MVSRQQRYEATEKGRAARHAARARYKAEPLWLGIDGEGKGRAPHRYTLLAVSDASGKYQRHISGHDLGTVQCLEFMLGLPSKARLFAYSFRYDLSLILRDLDDDTLFRLFRPELRQGKRGPRPVQWGEFTLNLVGTKFTVRRGSRSQKVWDVFKFFQSSFVNALRDWKVGLAVLERMQVMKDKRGEFDDESDEAILRYCLEECQCMAELARKLTDAHEAAGLELTNYYGAGSTASAVLDRMGVAHARELGPEEMQHAVACAFFGGRFENSVLGPVNGPVYSLDISSAYPYQLTQLPCLIHARWELTRKRSGLEGAQQAIVNYRLSDSKRPWGPFPFRSPDGTITYPASSGGGWVYLPEYLAGESQFPGVQFRSAWVLHKRCDCPCIFGSVPELYRERVRIGKEGPGIVIKLGMNSVYGKLAQSVGSPPYQSWLWAGMVTSGCRAQILQLMAQHTDPANLLMIATDGVYTRENVEPPKPVDTSTSDMSKPLGGWEKKVLEKGVFCARPGVYFPLAPTKEELKEVKARGVGKSLLLDQWSKVVEAYERGPQADGWYARLDNVTRFVGAVTGTHLRAGEAVRSPDYGQWVEREVKLSLDPAPKRRLGKDGSLELLHFPKQTSAPYENALSEEALELKLAGVEELEQP